MCIQYFYQLRANWIADARFDLEFNIDFSGQGFSAFQNEARGAEASVAIFDSCTIPSVETWTFTESQRNDVSAVIYLAQSAVDLEIECLAFMSLTAVAWGSQVAQVSCTGSECNVLQVGILELNTAEIYFPCI